MSIRFHDHFSGHSAQYSQFRPQYPLELFAFLASISCHHQTAWDCATGTGQSALTLSDYFTEIIATDASNTQIDSAIHKSGVTYRVASAESSHIETSSIDLITVAQAFHWFDIDAFASEADRVLKTGGILAIWTYNLLSLRDDIDPIINHLYKAVLGEFWPKQRALVENGYADIKLPFSEISAPAFHLSAQWDLYQLTGYLNTWSAVREYQKQFSKNPVEEIQPEILRKWGPAEKVLPVKWPLSIRVWKK